MSFIWGCYFHASFQILGNPDVRCCSRIKIRATGLSVARVTTFVVCRGWSRQRGNGNVDRHGNFVYGGMTEFRQPLQVQSHLEVPRILVQLGHIQRT